MSDEPPYRTQRIEHEDYFNAVLANFFRRIFRRGKSRPMRGILERLTEEQRKAALEYVEPEAVKH